MSDAVLPALPDQLAREVGALTQRGEHAAAAAALEAHGFPSRAARIYEQIFEHAKALAAYESAGDVVAAARMAIEASDAPALDRLVTRAIGLGRGAELLADLTRSGRATEEARVHTARGDLVAAADAWARAGHLDRASAVLEEAGQLRESGVLLERHLESHPDDVESGIRLGRVLARFGRHDDAIRALQRAVKLAGPARDAALVRAAPTLLLSFVQLGYDAAAREVIKRWAAAWTRATRVGPDLAHRASPAAEASAVDSAGGAGGAVDRVDARAALEAPPLSLEAFLQSDRVAALAAIQERPKPPTGPPRDALAGADAPGSAAADNSMDALFGAAEGEAVDLELPPAPDEKATTLDDTLLLGGRYLLGEPLGGGGVGQVFRAFDAFADRPVAVKIFGAQVLASDAVREFAREVRAFAELRHPAVAALVELNVAQGFAVTDLVHGVSMEEKLAQGGGAGWLVPAMRSLLDLLATSHRTGLVHGGLKPTSVFILDVGVRVVDVGAHHLLALRSTETGGLASVWAYLAPEQLFGAPASASGDLYAVGALLFRALTGRPPFERAEEDRRLPPPLASSLNPTVDAAWTAFLARALAPDVTQRFTDADEMARALPALPPAHELPAGAHTRAGPQTVAGRSDRYARGGLVDRPRAGVRVYAGTDLALDRRVWLVEADDVALLRPLIVCARQWRGVQPVYDVIPDASLVVLAHDEGVVDLATLRAVPQGLARDLAGLASALTWLHGQGWAVGGFDLERARAAVGLRLRLAPAALLVEETAEARARDWASFGALVDAAFELVPDATLDGRGRLLAMLHDRRLLDSADLDALGAEARTLSGWQSFLEAVASRLVLGASSRVVARVVANVLRGP